MHTLYAPTTQAFFGPGSSQAINLGDDKRKSLHWGLRRWIQGAGIREIGPHRSAELYRACQLVLFMACFLFEYTSCLLSLLRQWVNLPLSHCMNQVALPPNCHLPSRGFRIPGARGSQGPGEPLEDHRSVGTLVFLGGLADPRL